MCQVKDNSAGGFCLKIKSVSCERHQWWLILFGDKECVRGEITSGEEYCLKIKCVSCEKH